VNPRAGGRRRGGERAGQQAADDRPAPPLPPGGGLLLVDKPSGCTSHDVVGRLRHVLRTRRIGHAGTLDPMATGLLVLAVDRSTRLLGHLALTDKTYLGTIRLGQQTDTDDADGTVIRTPVEADLGQVTDGAIEAGVAALTGEVQQVPSSVSAIKVGGRRAYHLVRAGETVELAARSVTVSRFDIIGSPRRGNGEHGPFIDLDVGVDCTTGTYVRSLARDLGAGLGVGGHLTSLRRTRVGPFGVQAAVDVFGTDAAVICLDVPPAQAEPGRSGPPRPPVTASFAADIAGAIIPAAQAVRLSFPVRTVDDAQSLDLRHGRTIDAAGIPGTYSAFDGAGALIALVVEQGGTARSVLGWQIC
jgi:tRNA pseudouridine55 synthase